MKEQELLEYAEKMNSLSPDVWSAFLEEKGVPAAEDQEAIEELASDLRQAESTQDTEETEEEAKEKDSEVSETVEQVTEEAEEIACEVVAEETINEVIAKPM